ncbi:MAG: PHP domain-containing protein [Oscillospiraceae bacterium]|nr:PHP domain-containing protein [Oscillospiraceae bacterium]
MYYSNHNHTEESNIRFSDSTIKVESLIDRAIELGYSGVNISDHECISGHVRFLHHYEKLKKDNKLPKDFKVSLGNEIYLIESLDNIFSGKERFWHFVLTAKNEKGFFQLKQLSSQAWGNMITFKGIDRPYITYSQLQEIIGDNKGNLIATSACLGSYLNECIFEYFRDNKPEGKQGIHKYICWCIDTFGEENFFLEIQPSSLLDTEQAHRQEYANKKLAMLAELYGVGTIVATDSHYLKKEHKPLHMSFLKGNDDEGSGRETGDFYDATYMMSENEIRKHLANHLTPEEIDRCFAGTMKIYSMIEEYTLDKPIIVPQDKHIKDDFKIRHIFRKWYDRCPDIKQFAYSKELNDRYFLYLVEQGFLRHKQPFDELHIDRINIEIHQLIAITQQLGQCMSKYYTLVRNLIHNVLWNVTLIPPGRGSVGGFYCAYLLDICQLSAIDYDLPWWRHIHESKVSLADIDIDTEKAKRGLILEEMQKYYGKDNVLNCLTMTTVGSKSAILISGRGLGYNKDEMQVLADLIPVDRGKVRSLKECFEGNKEKDMRPVTELVNKMKNYPELMETTLLIEGLINGRSIHASAVYIFENGYIHQNSLMMSKNKVPTTAFTMEDSDALSALKMDLLTVEAADKIRKCVELLCDYGYLEKQPTFKETYYKYLYPDKLNYDNNKMWQRLDEGKIFDAFQMDTIDGSKAIRMIQPQNLRELAAANSLMRLQGDIPPINKYVVYKKDINFWYEDMQKEGLNQDEIDVLKDILGSSYGIACEQEAVMILSQSPKISNFTMKQSDKLRKVIAKKKIKEIDAIKQLYYENGYKAGTRKEMLDYVWNHQISYSLGYSFSLLHTTAYSLILLQEMNLACHFPSVFWDTSCLIINSSSDEENTGDKINYVKISKTLSSLGREIISPPDINTANFSFVPDPVKNKIIYSLKAIPGVNETAAKEIVANRPYESFGNFIEKMNQVKERYKNTNTDEENADEESTDVNETEEEDTKKFRLNTVGIINLIKAGSFDSIEPRQQLLMEYANSISSPLKSVTTVQIPTLEQLGYFTDDDMIFVNHFKYKKQLFTALNVSKKIGKSSSTWWYRIPKNLEDYFASNFLMYLNEDQYTYSDSGIVVKRQALEKTIDTICMDFKEKLKSPEVLSFINEHKADEILNKYECNQSFSHYEMKTLGVYLHEHELKKIDYKKYNITKYGDIPAAPVILDSREYRGRICYTYELNRICGVCLGVNKAKHVVFLLTPEDDIVTVKFYSGAFVHYNQNISRKENGKNVTLEESWFKRGTLLMICGIKRDSMFFAKSYKASLFSHSVMKITQVTNDSEIRVQAERFGEIREDG